LGNQLLDHRTGGSLMSVTPRHRPFRRTGDSLLGDLQDTIIVRAFDDVQLDFNDVSSWVGLPGPPVEQEQAVDAHADGHA
jgi:hypothetical protein